MLMLFLELSLVEWKPHDSCDECLFFLKNTTLYIKALFMPCSLFLFVEHRDGAV